MTEEKFHFGEIAPQTLCEGLGKYDGIYCSSWRQSILSVRKL